MPYTRSPNPQYHTPSARYVAPDEYTEVYTHTPRETMLPTRKPVLRAPIGLTPILALHHSYQQVSLQLPYEPDVVDSNAPANYTSGITTMYGPTPLVAAIKVQTEEYNNDFPVSFNPRNTPNMPHKEKVSKWISEIPMYPLVPTSDAGFLMPSAGETAWFNDCYPGVVATLSSDSCSEEDEEDEEDQYSLWDIGLDLGTAQKSRVRGEVTKFGRQFGLFVDREDVMEYQSHKITRYVRKMYAMDLSEAVRKGEKPELPSSFSDVLSVSHCTSTSLREVYDHERALDSSRIIAPLESPRYNTATASAPMQLHKRVLRSMKTYKPTEGSPSKTPSDQLRLSPITRGSHTKTKRKSLTYIPRSFEQLALQMPLQTKENKESSGVKELYNELEVLEDVNKYNSLEWTGQSSLKINQESWI